MSSRDSRDTPIITNPDFQKTDGHWYKPYGVSYWVWAASVASVGIFIAMRQNSANVPANEKDDSWLCTIDEEFDMPFYDCEKLPNLGEGNHQNVPRFDSSDYTAASEMIVPSLIALVAAGIALAIMHKRARGAEAV